jgi:acetyl esterase
MAALGMPPLGSLSPQETRAQMVLQRAAAPPGQPVARVEDRAIPGPAGEIPVRIYTPDGDAPFPVLVYLHGGGWVLGNVETHDATCREVANAAGCIVVSVDYRLAPEHKFPAGPEDCYAAYRWVADTSASFGGDASRIAVGGDSAGANLATVVCLMVKERGGRMPAFQVLIYPATDYAFDKPSHRENAEGYLLTTDSLRWFWDHYLNSDADAANPYASPLRADDLTGLPPALIITAEFDPLRDEGEAYGDRLRAAGVPVVVSRYDGMIHGFFGMSLIVDKAKQAVGEVAGALKTAFAGQPV